LHVIFACAFKIRFSKPAHTSEQNIADTEVTQI